jgi:peptide-methionine (S)-S-oxide reductase
MKLPGIVVRVLLVSFCSAGPAMGIKEETMIENPKLEFATFGAGCFWCVEAVFQELEGVEKVVSGYSGGHVENPTYQQVCTTNTGHAEVCQIQYDPGKIGFEQLLEVFWKTHDPTTRNRQGNDVGPQYRSVIFYHDPAQKRLAESYKEKLAAAGIWSKPIVTEIVPFTKFWPAEDYHQNYYSNNPTQGYCAFVITPKLDKFRKVFREQLKEEKPEARRTR